MTGRQRRGRGKKCGTMPEMDEKRTAYSLKAPGASGAAAHLPGRSAAFPRLDDHLVVPEVTRDEIIKGRRVVSHPAQRPHGRQHSQLDFLVRGLVAPGHETSSDLLTRMGQDSDFASDACIYKVDPETDTRSLEELAFEVVSTQSTRNVTEKAEVMHERGVRRIFAIFAREPRRVCEWSPETRSWRVLDPGSRIEDPCLVTPLAVSALLDAASADDAVAEALLVKQNPVILREVAAGEARGEARGRAEAIVQILEARGIAVSPAQRQKILSCTDVSRLDRWLTRAVVAAAVDEVTAEP